jgi:hypothetical protein
MLHAGTGFDACPRSSRDRVRRRGGATRAACAGPDERRRSRQDSHPRGPGKGVRLRLGGLDRIVHPNGAVDGRGVEAMRRGRGGCHHGGVGLWLPDVRRVEGAGLPWCTARQEALDAAHEDLERRAGVALAEVSRRETAHEAVDAETAHGLVAKAEARVHKNLMFQAPLLLFLHIFLIVLCFHKDIQHADQSKNYLFLFLS